MRDFKFFKGTLEIMDDETRATASFSADTPEGYMNRRMLYHTNRDMYERLNNPTNNNEMERYYYDHGLGRFETVRPTLNQEEVTRRINGGMSQEEILRRRHNFFEKERATTVNPKWWIKIKMFFQTISLYWDQIWGVAVFAAMATISVGLVISKLLNIW